MNLKSAGIPLAFGAAMLGGMAARHPGADARPGAREGPFYCDVENFRRSVVSYETGAATVLKFGPLFTQELTCPTTARAVVIPQQPLHLMSRSMLGVLRDEAFRTATAPILRTETSKSPQPNQVPVTRPRDVVDMGYPPFDKG
jgi:hypothetical protein